MVVDNNMNAGQFWTESKIIGLFWFFFAFSIAVIIHHILVIYERKIIRSLVKYSNKRLMLKKARDALFIEAQIRKKNIRIKHAEKTNKRRLDENRLKVFCMVRGDSVLSDDECMKKADDIMKDVPKLLLKDIVNIRKWTKDKDELKTMIETIKTEIDYAHKQTLKFLTIK